VAKTLTRRLITFSKGGKPNRQPADIVGIVENAAAFSLSGSNIGYELSPHNGTWAADVDAQQIGQAIHNLIVNAMESMPSGGTVAIGFKNEIIDSPNSILTPGRYVDITITDHGKGIPDEHIDRIFDPYFSTKGKGADKGTGLGLSISHSIITKHGGDITVCSRIGRGTTFHVMLPATREHPTDTAPRPDDALTKPSDKPVCGRGRILVMDDEAMIRELAGNILGHLGYDADFAMEGGEAIDKYRSALESARPYDAVILDLTIKGGMGGQDTIAALRRIDPTVKAIVSSGYAENPVLANYQRYGFCEVVAKPYDMIEFSKKLYGVVHHNANGVS
jgi:CheY-like chemotaxis protein